jgi:hypothetical protein
MWELRFDSNRGLTIRRGTATVRETAWQRFEVEKGLSELTSIMMAHLVGVVGGQENTARDL